MSQQCAAVARGLAVLRVKAGRPQWRGRLVLRKLQAALFGRRVADGARQAYYGAATRRVSVPWDASRRHVKPLAEGVFPKCHGLPVARQPASCEHSTLAQICTLQALAIPGMVNDECVKAGKEGTSPTPCCQVNHDKSKCSKPHVT